jgi:mannose-1-phosphate guanylyltransferase
MSRKRDEGLWAVVLAAGQGKRLASLTAALYGYELPKQFAVLDGRRSLLQATMERIAPLAPARRTVVVVGREHELLARRQLRGFPGTIVTAQPKNLDTGPGILLPLARIRAWDPGARVAIFPSDHFVADAAPLLQAVRKGARACETAPDLVTLLGVAADRPETEYGWIVPVTGMGAHGESKLRGVRRFVEKPSLPVAQRLFRQGGLWNTFISVGRLSACWRLAEQHLPRHALLFEHYSRSVGTGAESSVLEALYHDMPPANFSRTVLERCGGLAVAPVHGSGWSDWGSPHRVFRSLEGTPHLARLRERLAVSASALALA